MPDKPMARDRRIGELDDVQLLLVEQRPVVLALYRHGHPELAEEAAVVAWVLVTPDGGAIVVPTEPGGPRPIVSTIGNVRRRWTEFFDAELVEITSGHELRLAG